MLTDLFLWYHINYGVSFESFDDSDEVGCEDVSACCTESSLTDFSFFFIFGNLAFTNTRIKRSITISIIASAISTTPEKIHVTVTVENGFPMIIRENRMDSPALTAASHQRFSFGEEDQYSLNLIKSRNKKEEFHTGKKETKVSKNQWESIYKKDQRNTLIPSSNKNAVPLPTVFQ